MSETPNYKKIPSCTNCVDRDYDMPFCHGANVAHGINKIKQAIPFLGKFIVDYECPCFKKREEE